jgi:hypothetical protein
MDIMELGAIGELVGGVAVIASLVYVGLQIRQNTGAMRAASAQNLVTVSTNGHFLLAADNGLAEIIQRGFPHPEGLKDHERSRFNSCLLGFYVQ